MTNKNEDIFQELKDEVAAHIRAARAYRNMKQSEVAKAAGVSPKSISLIEQGKANARIGTIGKILAAMGYRLMLGLNNKKE